MEHPLIEGFLPHLPRVSLISVLLVVGSLILATLFIKRRMVPAFLGSLVGLTLPLSNLWASNRAFTGELIGEEILTAAGLNIFTVVFALPFLTIVLFVGALLNSLQGPRDWARFIVTMGLALTLCGVLVGHGLMYDDLLFGSFRATVYGLFGVLVALSFLAGGSDGEPYKKNLAATCGAIFPFFVVLGEMGYLGVLDWLAAEHVIQRTGEAQVEFLTQISTQMYQPFRVASGLCVTMAVTMSLVGASFSGPGKLSRMTGGVSALSALLLWWLLHSAIPGVQM